MSYHNGSVWPHDNAMIARGFSRYGIRRGTLQIMTGLLDASIFLDLHRLPELFCGFQRRPGQSPTFYPVACSPESWASASVFLILEACLGIRIIGSPPQVLFRRTELPPSLPRVEIKNLRIGDSSADIVIRRAGEGIDVQVLRREGELDVISVK